MLDILIRDGYVVDGSGKPRFRADVGIAGERIADVGLMPGATAKVVIDASGCVVTPGFVDMHSHSDFSLPINPTADSLVQQGITTAVVGQCGSTPAPLLEETREQVVNAMASEDRPLPWDEWSSLGDYLTYLANLGTSINVVPLLGQGMVRAGVMGFGADAPNDDQMARMQTEVRKGMDEGAIGVSTGLIYPPGSYATTDEIVAFTRPAGERDGFYFSHIRGEGQTLLEAVAEAIHIGRETGAAVQIAHFKAAGRENWDKSAQALELIDQVRAEGLDVSADLYPYLASSTGLSAMLPQWAHVGGKDSLRERLVDPNTRQAMTADMAVSGYAKDVEWDKVLISRAPRNRAYEGRTVADLAAEGGKAPTDWVFDALLELDLDASIVKFGMSEENRAQELRHPAMMIGTDGYGLATEGPMSAGVPHPRSYGTFPRVLSRYVRELGVISLEEAIWKMSGMPAQKLRWSDRGQLQKGFCADVVVLNPDAVADRATFEVPHQYPVGISCVCVNGELVVRDGIHTQARSGQVLGR